MAGIGKRFEAFRLLESISLMAFYYICFCQVLPKNIKFWGGIGAPTDSIVSPDLQNLVQQSPAHFDIFGDELNISS